MIRAAILALSSFLAITAAACSGTSEDLPGVLVPCNEPAPLTGNPNPTALGYTVELQPTADVAAEAARIASTCGVAVDHVYQFSPAFAAQLDLIQLGCVRCDSQVKSVFGNTVLYPL